MKKLIASLLLLFATGAFGAGSLTLPQFGGTGVANASTKTITLGGPLVTSGAYTTTLTVTGTTGITLPTTGTLATLGGTEELTGKTLDSSVGKGTWTASGTWTLPAVTLGGGAVIAASQSLTGTVANSTISGFLSISATTLAGTLSTAAQPNVTSLGTLAANLIFTDATYDIGASGATRPRDFFLSRNATIGGTLGVTGVATFTADAIFNGGSDAITVNSAAGVSQRGNIQVNGTDSGSAAINGYFGVNVFDTTDTVQIGSGGGAAIKINKGNTIVTMPNLAGVGTRAVVVDANGVLSAP